MVTIKVPEDADCHMPPEGRPAPPRTAGGKEEPGEGKDQRAEGEAPGVPYEVAGEAPLLLDVRDVGRDGHVIGKLLEVAEGGKEPVQGPLGVRQRAKRAQGSPRSSLNSHSRAGPHDTHSRAPRHPFPGPMTPLPRPP